MSKKLAIITDSNSCISNKEAEELGIYLIPMPFYIDEELYYENINLSQEQFYVKQEAGSNISTSQPSPGDVLELWDALLKTYDEIIYMPMSSGLSGTCETAMALAKDYDNRVVVVDNGRISLPLKQAVLDAYHMAEDGYGASEIEKVLMSTREEFEIFIIVDTLEYLKKGGRVTPAAAAIGSVLNVKPILQIGTEKIDSFAKARGMKKAKKIMLEAMEKCLNETFADQTMNLGVAYTCSEEELNIFTEEVKEHFPEYALDITPLSLSIATHIGPGSLAVTCYKSVYKKEN